MSGPVALVYDSRMAEYRFGSSHPLLPERFVLAVELMRAWDLLGEGPRARSGRGPWHRRAKKTCCASTRRPTSRVVENERSSAFDDESHGLGYGDTPRFPRHARRSRRSIAGGTIQRACELVLDGELRCARSTRPAGCITRTETVQPGSASTTTARLRSLARPPCSEGLRVAYVDIDAHHGDGVEEAFSSEVRRADDLASRVRPVSLSRHRRSRGGRRRAGRGLRDQRAAAAATRDRPSTSSRSTAWSSRRLTAFRPDVIVAQLGADSHRSRPADAPRDDRRRATRSLVSRIVSCADSTLRRPPGGGRRWRLRGLLGDAAHVGVRDGSASGSRSRRPSCRRVASSLRRDRRWRTARYRLLSRGTFDEAPVPQPAVSRRGDAARSPRARSRTRCEFALLARGCSGGASPPLHACAIVETVR